VLSIFCKTCARPLGYCSALGQIYDGSHDCDGDDLPDPEYSTETEMLKLPTNSRVP